MFYDNPQDLIRVLLVGVSAYVGLILMLRLSGKRTLSKMNAFDFVVTVAIGSTLATVLLSKGVALVEGLLAFAVLIGLQLVVTWTSIRSAMFRRWIKAEPKLLFHQGVFLNEAMRQERVTKDEVRAGMRSRGFDEPAAVKSVILETDGSLSVIARRGG